MTLPGRITIGRVGLIDGAGNGIPLNVPDSGSWRGDTLSIGGDIDPAAAGGKTQALVLRRQLQGLAAATGEVRPATFGDTPELDGYYRVGSIQITSPRGDPGFAHGSFGWSVELTPVDGWASALLQSRLQGGLRGKPDGTANAHSITTAHTLSWWSPGLVAPATFSMAGVSGASVQLSRPSVDGTVHVLYDTAEFYFDASPSWYTPPGDYYKASAGIAMDYGTGTYYGVVGDQIQNRPGHWALGNGLVTVLGSTSQAFAQFSILWFGGTAFESLKTVRVTLDGTNLAPWPAAAVRILCNTPERAAVRVYFATTGIDGRLTLDLSLRRGAKHVEGLLSSPTGRQWGVKLATNEAGTNHTSGIHASSADADGNKYILTSPQAVTTDANGGIYLSSASTRLAFMVGAELAGSGAGDNFTDLVFQYFAYQAERQRVVVP